MTQSLEPSIDALLKDSPLPTFVVDREHRVRHWNGACERMFGVAAQEIEGTFDQWRPFYPERRPILADLVLSRRSGVLIPKYYGRKCRPSGAVPGGYEGEDFFPQLGDEGRRLHFAAAPLRDADGHVVGAIETFVDVTGRDRAHDALRRSEATLRATVENNGDVMILWLDEARRVVFANAAVGAVLGRSRRALLGRTPGDACLFAAAPIEALDARLDALDRGELVPGAREFQAIAGDDRPRIVRMNVSSLPGAASGPRYALLAIDVTDARQSENSLRREHLRLKNIVDHFPGGVMLIDEELRIVQHNETYRRALDLPADLFAAGPVPLRHVVQFKAARGEYGGGEPAAHVEAILANTTRATPQRFERIRPDGTVLQIDATPLPHGGFVTTYTDVTESRQTERRLQALLNEHRVIFDNAHVGIIYVEDRIILQCNRRMAEIYGYAGPDELIGNTTTMLYPSTEIWHHNGKLLYERLATQGFSEDEVLQRRRDGTPIWCHRLGRPIDPAAPHGGSIWVYSDITGMKRQQEQLELAHRVFDNSAEALIICDPSNRIVSVNRAFTQITGYSAEEVVGKTPSLLRSGCHDSRFYRHMWDRLLSENRWEGEIRDRRKNGEIYPKWLSISTVRDADGAIVNFVATFSDISSRKEAEERAQFLSRHDPLTRLPNLVLLRERFEQAARNARSTGRQLALLVLDLDHFKRVNDSLGHPIGDALLVAVAERLRATLYTRDMISRQGGDEFMILLEHLARCDDVVTVARKIGACLDAPIEIEGHMLSCSFSIGVAVFPGDGEDFDTLMKKADTAMYHAKDHGRGTFSYFDDTMNAKAAERLALHGRLRQAIGRDEFHLLYQPQVDLRSGRTFGAEALLRWTPADGPPVGPDRFIPVAEESGLILSIGEWVMHEAFRQARRWHTAGEPLKVGINVSGLQIYRSDLVATLAAIARDTGVAPDAIEIELTESTLMEDADAARDVLAALKRAGYSIAIDDFGTGYSSLAYLKKFPLDRLKIDRSFITDLCGNPEDQAIARAVIQIARSLNLRVIAEGVETAEQMALLQRHGCHEGQGYLFGRPVRATEIAATLDAKVSAARRPN